MKQFKDIITLNKNARGCYILDTVKGCSVSLKEKPNGCYGDCYAKNIASRYGLDFTKPVNRKFHQEANQLFFNGFEDCHHEAEIIKQIKKASMSFVRIGEMGDPSENWEHTINVCKIISQSKKPIVIITKHWKTIPDNLLSEIEKLNICINTAISALDNEDEINHRLSQFNKMKNYCNSVLRIVSCDYNKKNKEAKQRNVIQEKLFNNDKIIDTVFRPSPKNPLVINNIINVEKIMFLKQNVLASVHNKNAYFGMCDTCPDMCGIIKGWHSHV
jgi:hypothetical protein